MKTNDGGPAFPQRPNQTCGTGMTLRDYFAAKALRMVWPDGWVMEQTGGETEPATVDFFNEVAADAYALADAMLRAREQQP